MVRAKPKSGLAGHERDLLDRDDPPSCPDGPVGPVGPRLITLSYLSRPIPFIPVIPLNFFYLTFLDPLMHVGYVRIQTGF